MHDKDSCAKLTSFKIYKLMHRAQAAGQKVEAKHKCKHNVTHPLCWHSMGGRKKNMLHISGEQIETHHKWWDQKMNLFYEFQYKFKNNELINFPIKVHYLKIKHKLSGLVSLGWGWLHIFTAAWSFYIYSRMLKYINWLGCDWPLSRSTRDTTRDTLLSIYKNTEIILHRVSCQLAN